MISRIYRVDQIAVDATFPADGSVPILKISASGTVNSGGWTNPELAPWSYIVPPNDGMLDIDFLASPPPPNKFVTMAFAKIVANCLLPVPDWVTGIRVHASTNAMEKTLVAPLVSLNFKPFAEGLPVPWPFPWFVPQPKLNG